MDISIRSVGEACAVSGTAFQPGDRVWSYLYRTAEGFVERADVLAGERDHLDLDDAVLCRWSHVIKEKETSGAEERRAALQSADEVFLSLFEDPEEGAGQDPSLKETRDRLKFFLALQLERKRILRHMGGRHYRHMPSKREVTVPEMEISPDLIAKFQDEISLMGQV